MSLKPTPKNQTVVGIALSAETWARHAIGGDKRTGPEGFEKYRSQGGWYHPMHYRHISGSNPEWSPPEAADEMADIRECLVAEIDAHAKELDAMVMRLQRMEEQMGNALSNNQLPDA